jgi:hypothetical protein
VRPEIPIFQLRRAVSPAFEAFVSAGLIPGKQSDSGSTVPLFRNRSFLDTPVTRQLSLRCCEWQAAVPLTAHTAVVHTGGSGGYRAYYIRLPEQHFSVACFCNLEDVNRRKRVGAVIETHLGGLVGGNDRTVEPGPTPQQLEALVGTYQDAKTREVNQARH